MEPDIRLLAAEAYWAYGETTNLDTLRSKDAEILDSTSPLSLDPLRYLSQRWFSPQALTFPMPWGSWMIPKFVLFEFCVV